jgi:hypothetical protein
MAPSFSIHAADDPFGQGLVVLETGEDGSIHLHAQLFTPTTKTNSICLCMIYGGEIPQEHLRKRSRRDQD